VLRGVEVPLVARVRPTHPVTLMKETPKGTRSAVPLLAVAGLVLPAFGAGVLIGWLTRERWPAATEARDKSVSDPEVIKELEACQQALAARSQASAPFGHRCST